MFNPCSIADVLIKRRDRVKIHGKEYVRLPRRNEVRRVINVRTVLRRGHKRCAVACNNHIGKCVKICGNHAVPRERGTKSAECLKRTRWDPEHLLPSHLGTQPSRRERHLAHPPNTRARQARIATTVQLHRLFENVQNQRIFHRAQHLDSSSIVPSAVRLATPPSSLRHRGILGVSRFRDRLSFACIKTLHCSLKPCASLSYDTVMRQVV
mmetsp:Transcript_10130/g.27172  ORF Transcript_10130/g.27172 Transcript_10130/m.27172 type:complete len:210 (-) Transcript_10130:630-1259(-)